MGIQEKYYLFAIILILTKLTGIDCDWGTCLLEPQFISQWSKIIAQDLTHSSAISEHGIGSFPIKVDVQIRPEDSQPENHFYFPGIGSSQRDDDVNSPYGGIVYYYNKESVSLFSPIKQDGFDAGRVIFTGGNAWIGPVQQSEKSAMYRVRVWGKEQFPKPDFESSWLPMDTSMHTYREVTHGLGVEPDFTLVQIRLPSGHITEAVGSSMELNQNSTDWGGVIYAYNDSIFKLWSPNDRKGGIFSTGDGWGKHGKLVHSGTVKIYAWKFLFALRTFRQTVTLPSISSTMDLKQNIDRDYDFIDVKVEAFDGKSNNFTFHASGAVQNVRLNDSIGGLVYAYSDSQFRFWYPSKGSLIIVDQSWGKPNTQHTSQKARVTIEIYNNFKSCPPVTTRLAAKQLATTNHILVTKRRQHSASTIKRALVSKQQHTVRVTNRTVTTKQQMPFRTSQIVTTKQQQLPVRTSSHTVTTKQKPPVRTIRRTATTKQQLPVRTKCPTATTKQQLPVRTASPTATTKQQLPVRTTNRTVATKQQHQPIRSTNRAVTSSTHLQHIKTDKKEFSFSNIDLPTVLVGAGFGVGGSVLLFTIVGCVIKFMTNKAKKNEVKPF